MHSCTGTNVTPGANETCADPERQITDYIEMMILLVVFLIGAPLNLCAFTYLREKSGSSGPSRLLYLKQHLNLSDMFVVFIYAVSRFCWLLTYDWRGGDVLCPVISFLNSFSLSISSYIIVSIALDRMATVLLPKYYSHSRAKKGVIMLLTLAWLFALLCSIPQLITWRVFTSPGCRNEVVDQRFVQCTTIWWIKRGMESKEELYLLEKVYSIFHLASVFWSPACVVVLCYIVIAVWTAKHGNIGRSDSCAHAVAATADDYSTTCSLQVPLANKLPSRCSQSQLAKRRILQMSVLIVGAYIICWLPYNLLAAWEYIDYCTYAKHQPNLYFLYSLTVFNSVVNPVLYGAVSLRCYPSRRLA